MCPLSANATIYPITSCATEKVLSVRDLIMKTLHDLHWKKHSRKLGLTCGIWYNIHHPHHHVQIHTPIGMFHSASSMYSQHPTYSHDIAITTWSPSLSISLSHINRNRSPAVITKIFYKTMLVNKKRSINHIKLQNLNQIICSCT